MEWIGLLDDQLASMYRPLTYSTTGFLVVGFACGVFLPGREE